MPATALLFPGQGSHHAGMEEPWREHPTMRRGLDVLGFDPFARLDEGTAMQSAANSRFTRWRNPLWNPHVSVKRSKSELPSTQKERTPAHCWSPGHQNSFAVRPIPVSLTPLALLFRRLFLCRLFLCCLFLRFGLGLGLRFFLGSLLRRLLGRRFRSRRPRSGSGRRLRLFFAV